MAKINVLEAKKLAIEASPYVCDNSSVRDPWFPRERQDIGVVQKGGDDGKYYGRTALYIAYKSKNRTFIMEIFDTGNIHININDRFRVWSVEIIKGKFTIEIGFAGGANKIIEKKLSELGLC